MNCSECGKFEAYVIRSCLRLDGRRCRRYACQACGHRWTVYQAGEKEARPSHTKKLDYTARRLQRKLTNWEAAEILMSQGLSARELAAKYQISRPCVQSILTGKTYREVYQVLHPYAEEPEV